MNFNQNIKINNKYINSKRCFIVAEISANHSGDLNHLKKMIFKLKKINVDAIKIQAYQANTITIKSEKKDFRINNKNTWSKYKTLYQLYKKAETPFNWYKKIFTLCNKLNIPIFASVFDFSSLEIMKKLNCPAYKVASPEITDIPLMEKIAETKKPIIISTGLADLKDLKLAVKSIKNKKNKNLIILKCTSSYPASIKDLNLKTMDNIKKKFGCLVGFSDHTIGYDQSIHAASLGASVLEKHVTLNKKSLDGFFSLSINEFKLMIKKIRNNEISNGEITYKIPKSSKINLQGRKSLYIVKNIKKNEIFSEDNIKSIRPSYGLHPKYLKLFLGKKSKMNIKFGTRLSWRHIINQKKI